MKSSRPAAQRSETATLESDPQALARQLLAESSELRSLTWAEQVALISHWTLLRCYFELSGLRSASQIEGLRAQLSTLTTPIPEKLRSVTYFDQNLSQGFRAETSVLLSWSLLSALHQTGLATGGPPTTESRGRETQRRRAGRYYTPYRLAARLVDTAIPDLTGPHRPLDQLRLLRCLDPSCGAGVILLVLARRLARALAERRGEPDRKGQARAFLSLVSSTIFGIDLDPIALELARLGFAISALRQRAVLGLLRSSEPLPKPNLLCANSLESPWASPFELSGFDFIVGNPPFRGAIVRSKLGRKKPSIRLQHPRLKGTADLAYRFLDLACREVKPESWIALVQPRKVLNAGSLRELRERPAKGLVLRAVLSLRSLSSFAGARVPIACVSLGPAGPCRFAEATDLEAPRWFEPGGSVSSNWWEALQSAVYQRQLVAGAGVPRLGEVFELSASLTTKDYYELADKLIDSAEGPGLKLLTTGLIEPGGHLWGIDEALILGRRLKWPRLPEDGALNANLLRRKARACQPKVLVAGLGKRLEALFDPESETIGAVATFTVTHPRDCTFALGRLAEHLNSEIVQQRLYLELGGNAMGGGSITVTKSFLLALPLDASFQPSTQAAEVSEISSPNRES